MISIRKEKKMSQEEMAQKLAMEQTTYSRKERGKSPITKNEWVRIADALGVHVHDIKEEPAPTYKNENFTLNDHCIANQTITVHQELLDTVLRYNSYLEAENERLRREK